MELIQIAMRLTGAQAVAAESKVASGAIAGTGTATTAAGTAAAAADTKTSRYSRTVSTLGRVARTSAIALGAGLAYEAYRSVNAFREAAKVGAQTEAVVKSTGGAANLSAKQVSDLSSSLSLKTGIDDEVIQSGANMLLTFKNIRNETGKGNDIFTQSTSVINDMSAALGTDLKGSAIQLGKALNDPIAGISALSRVGVTFDEQTKEQITTLTEQGDLMAAQKIILSELNSEFGGSAKASTDVFDRLKVSFENIEEQIGSKLIPVLKDGARWLSEIGSILNDKSLSGDQKWDRIGDKISSTLTKGLEKAAEFAPKLAGVIVRGFLGANAWVKLAGGLWLLNKLTGGGLLGKVASAGAGAGAKFGSALAQKAGLWLIGTGVADSLIGLFGANGKILTALKPIATKAGGIAGRAFGVGFVTLGATYLANELGPMVDSAAAKVFGGTAEENSNLLESLGGPDLGGGVRDFLGLAGGTNWWGGGPSLVGERGPEIVNLPRGAEVIPNDRIGSAAAPRPVIHTHVYLNRREIALAVQDEVLTDAALA